MTTFLPVRPSSETTRQRALWLSTIAFTACFCGMDDLFDHRHPHQTRAGPQRNSVWPTRRHANPHGLAGSARPRHLDRPLRRQGRLTFTMLAAAAATFLLAHAATYAQMLFAALGVGLAGGSFAVGVAYVSRFFPAERQGTALGIFGAATWVRRSRTSSLLSCFSPGAGRLSLRCGPEPSPSWLCVLVLRQRRPGVPAAPNRSHGSKELLAGACSAEKSAGLALRALLFLRFWRLRRARALAATLFDRRLRLRRRDRGHDWRGLFHSGQPSSGPMAACCPTASAPEP